MQQEIEKRMIELTKQTQERMTEETGIEPSITEDEIKQYLTQVINEVRKRKGTINNNPKYWLTE
jgi:hypothetical protein